MILVVNFKANSRSLAASKSFAFFAALIDEMSDKCFVELCLVFEAHDGYVLNIYIKIYEQHNRRIVHFKTVWFRRVTTVKGFDGRRSY